MSNSFFVTVIRYKLIVIRYPSRRSELQSSINNRHKDAWTQSFTMVGIILG